MKCLHKKLEIVVIRTDNNGNLKNSKPCSHCIKNMKLFNIKYVYYSTDDGKIIKERVENLTTDHLSGGQKNLKRLLKGKTNSIQKSISKIN